MSDRYPNDSDIVCRFSFNLGVPSGTFASDRVGLYRVPYLEPHQHIAFQWMSEAQGDEKSGFYVVFRSASLPKDEDFYQFHYLRTENGGENVIGASIPFQLRSPSAEELCTVEVRIYQCF